MRSFNFDELTDAALEEIMGGADPFKVMMDHRRREQRRRCDDDIELGP